MADRACSSAADQASNPLPRGSGRFRLKPAPAPAPQKAPALDPLRAMMEAQEADPLSRMDLVVDPVDDDGPLGPLG